MEPVYATSKYVSSAVLCISMGMVMSPVVSVASPVLVAQAAAISLAVMGGSTAYAMRAQPGSLMPYKSVAYGALVGLIGVGFIGIFSSLFLGCNSLFYFTHSIDLYGGLALFTIINAIDTHNAIAVYKDGKPDYLACSIDMILNSINIFIRVLEIFSQKK